MKSADPGGGRRGAADVGDWGLRPRPVARAGWYALFAVLAIVAVMPITWMLSTALKPPPEIFVPGLRVLPTDPTVENFVRLWRGFPVGAILLNTLWVAVGITGAQLLTSLLAAYGFARFRFPLREPLFYACMGTMFIPIQVIMVSNYLLVSDWGLLNSYTGVVLPQVANGFGIFLLRQHLRVFPQPLLEAARIDGAGELTVLFRVVLPVVRPVLIALAILFFINSWNQYVWPTVVLTEPMSMTLPIWLRQFMHAEAGSDWGLLMAASSLGVVPALAVYLLAQRLVLTSLAGAGIKG